jgi:hypothetical protein
MAEQEEMITVIVESPALDSRRSALPSLGKHAIAHTVEVGGDALLANIRSFVSKFAPLLDEGALVGTDAHIEEIELSLAVTATGGVELIGKLTGSGTVGIKVTLKRNPSPS